MNKMMLLNNVIKSIKFLPTMKFSTFPIANIKSISSYFFFQKRVCKKMNLSLVAGANLNFRLSE